MTDPSPPASPPTPRASPRPRPPRAGSFWLGLTVGAILAAALAFSIYYVPRKGIALGREPLPFAVVLPEASGLHPGSPVLVSGVEAGEVTDVRIENLPRVGWRVLAMVELFDGERFGAMLTTGSTYAVSRSSLLGEMTLAITPGGPGGPLAHGALVDGTPPEDLGRILDDLGQVTRRAADFMDGRSPGDPSLKRAIADLQAMLLNLRELSDKLGP